MENNCCPCWSNCNKFGDNNNIEVNQLKNAASVVKDEPRKQTISILPAVRILFLYLMCYILFLFLDRHRQHQFHQHLQKYKFSFCCNRNNFF